MLIFILSFAIFSTVMILLSVGLLLKKKALKGSCGGLSALNIEKACDCDRPCGDCNIRD